MKEEKKYDMHTQKDPLLDCSKAPQHIRMRKKQVVLQLELGDLVEQQEEFLD